MVAAIRRGADLRPLPESVEALMAVQIDELASADRGPAAPGIRPRHPLHAWSFVAALGLDEADAEAVLGRLDRFLSADGEGGLRFRHGLLRDAAYHGLSFRRRRELHRRVGECSSAQPATTCRPWPTQLTHHFFEAGVWEKALRYGLVAGSAAHAVYANVDAAALLERAVAAGASGGGARPEAVVLAAETLGDVRLSLGELERAGVASGPPERRVRVTRSSGPVSCGRRRTLLPARCVRDGATDCCCRRFACSRL